MKHAILKCFWTKLLQNTHTCSKIEFDTPTGKENKNIYIYIYINNERMRKKVSTRIQKGF